MKKTIAILVILILASFGLFATDGDTTNGPVTINVTSEIAPIAIFGVSAKGVTSHYIDSIELFRQAISSTITIEVNMLALYGEPQIGFLSGINNTSSPVTIDITITDLVSGNNALALFVYPTQEVIPAASNSAFGLLLNTPVKITAQNKGRALVAPAGDYTATITFALTT